VKRADKEAFVADLQERVGKTSTLYLTDFSGLDVKAIDATIGARVEARQGRDFETADRLQRELLVQGVVLLDHADGTDWTLVKAPEGAD